MKVKDGKIIITKKDIDKGLNNVLTQEVIDKAVKQRFDKIQKEAMMYGWP